MGHGWLTSAASNSSCRLFIQQFNHKESIMKRNHKIIAGLVVAATLSGVAFARGGGYGGCDGSGPMAMGAQGQQAVARFNPGQRVERHLEQLKNQLQLNPQQEPLWQAFVEQMQEQAGKGMKSLRVARTAPADGQLTAPERMAQMQERMQERLNAMVAVQESFKQLYAALTPEQRLLADEYAAQMGKRPMRGKGGPAQG
jgi:hypothetical protein